ncbi:MAG TPA: hypothetical protein V6C72_19915 [Chroococcales cyanobacterium]
MPTTTKHPVHHHLPHRTRIKLPKNHRSPGNLKMLEDKVKKIPGVTNVAVNHKTGSVLVHHEERADMLPAVHSAIEEVAGEIFETLLEIEGVHIPGLPLLAHLFGRGMGVLNEQFSGATKNVIDLKTVVPMGFLTAALIRARSSPGWWAEVPAWALFYYAYDSYLKFHPMIPAAVSEAAAQQTEILHSTEVEEFAPDSEHDLNSPQGSGSSNHSSSPNKSSRTKGGA